MKAGSRVVMNTMVLYAKMAFTILISLYSVRLVLASLGEIDYGIFNVIMGVVSMLSFLNAALTVSTQRYLSFYQGKNDYSAQVGILNHSLFLHGILGLLIVLFLEIGGTFFFDHYLQIPLERYDVSKTIFHFVSISVFFTFISVPFSASINAHENMIFIALISILESIEKLALAIFITFYTGDKLLVYGLVMGCIPVVSFFIYVFICRKKYSECNNISFKNISKETLKDFGGFASWNLIGSITAMCKSQGLAVLFNVFLGPAVNAAYAVSNQVSAQLSFFSATMLRSLNPQIMKSEGSGDHERMLSLSVSACKFGFLLLAIFAIPCVFEMETILGLWLKKVPDYSVFFCDLILLAMLFDQLTVGINSGFQACKLVKQSSIFVGLVKLTLLPVGYVLLKKGCSAYSVLVLYAAVELFAGFVRLGIAKSKMHMSIRYYFVNVYATIFLPVLFMIVVCFVINKCVFSPYRIVVTFVGAVLVFSLSSYVFALNENERGFVKDLVKKIKAKII